MPDETNEYQYSHKGIDYKLSSNETKKKQTWYKKNSDDEWEEVDTKDVPSKVKNKFIDDRLTNATPKPKASSSKKSNDNNSSNRSRKPQREAFMGCPMM